MSGDRLLISFLRPFLSLVSDRGGFEEKNLFAGVKV